MGRIRPGGCTPVLPDSIFSSECGCRYKPHAAQHTLSALKAHPRHTGLCRTQQRTSVLGAPLALCASSHGVAISLLRACPRPKAWGSSPAASLPAGPGVCRVHPGLWKAVSIASDTAPPPPTCTQSWAVLDPIFGIFEPWVWCVPPISVENGCVNSAPRRPLPRLGPTPLPMALGQDGGGALYAPPLPALCGV